MFRTISELNTLPVSIIHAGSANAFNSPLTATPQRAAFPSFRLGPHGHLGSIIQIQISTGADPGFEKGGGAGGSWARPQDFFGQFRGLFKVFGAKRVGRVPPCAPPPLVPRLLQSIRHELQLTIATQTCQQESSTTKEMMTGIPRRLCG